MFNIKLSDNYTSLWDGYKNNIPVSIKHIKSGNSIDLGDIFRWASILNEFYMVIGFYNNNMEDDIHILYFKEKEWHKYFMDLENFENIFKQVLNEITNEPADDLRWRTMTKECKKLWAAHTPNIIRPNGKRDHKKQKRWQCSISKKDFQENILSKYEIKMENF